MEAEAVTGAAAGTVTARTVAVTVAAAAVTVTAAAATVAAVVFRMVSIGDVTGGGGASTGPPMASLSCAWRDSLPN